MDPLRIPFVVEGVTDVPVARSVLTYAGLAPGRAYVMGGKNHLDASAARYNQAARWQPWLVLRDLDSDAPCAAELLGRVLPEPAEWMVCRVAVRAMEAWLMGDAERLAEFLRVRRSLVPDEPEQLARPKRSLVELAARSASKTVRAQLTPRPGSTAQVGPEYAGRIALFAEQHWRVEAAVATCPSLARCLRALERLRAQLESA
mgnify:CR=1 FL=1